MMKKILAYIICFLFPCAFAFGQFNYPLSNELIAIKKKTFPSEYGKKNNQLLLVNFPDSTIDKAKRKRKTWFFGTSLVPLLNLVSYNSFLLNEKVKFKGFRLGAEIGERVRFGFGAYQLARPISLVPVISDVDTINRQLRFEYYNMFFDYVFYEDFRWELAIPFSLGKAFGEIDTFSSKNGNNMGHIKADSTALTTIGFDFEYRFIPWLGIGGGVGYRQAFAPKDIRDKLNAPFYTVKLKIFLGYLFKAIFKKEELELQRAEYEREKSDRRKLRKQKMDQKEVGEEVEKVEGINKPENTDY